MGGEFVIRAAPQPEKEPAAIELSPIGMPYAAPAVAAGSPAADVFSDDDMQFREVFGADRLRRTWKHVRTEARNLSIRDVVDFVDWAVYIEATFDELAKALNGGYYQPTVPVRHEAPKGRGAVRIITAPSMVDVLVYRRICDEVLSRAVPHSSPGVFFSRRRTRTPVGRHVLPDASYGDFFEIWRLYESYRSITLLGKLYEVLVVTDVANYFESISTELLLEYIGPYGLPRKVLGTLSRLLEALKPGAGHSCNPNVGIAVDEFDCSRQLAHVFLFEHDRRMLSAFGVNNYVRWMDDQNVGVASLTDARRAMRDIARSLSSQRLSVSAAKTKFVPRAELDEYFHLLTNQELTAWEKEFVTHGGNVQDINAASKRLEELYEAWAAQAAKQVGRWDKVLKRFYGLASLVGSSFLDSRAVQDIIDSPDIAARVWESFALRNRADLLIRTFESYCLAGENLFETIEASFWEACLLLNPTRDEEEALRKMARAFVEGTLSGQTGTPGSRSVALLALYWFGATAEQIGRIAIAQDLSHVPACLGRAWLATMFALDARRVAAIQRQLIGRVGTDVSRLVGFLEGVKQGDVDAIGKFVWGKKTYWKRPTRIDPRSWLQLEIVSRSTNGTLRREVYKRLGLFKSKAETLQEKRILLRVTRRQ